VGRAALLHAATTLRLISIALALALGVSPARALTAHLITGTSFVNHDPGPDLRIGSSDDGVLSGAIPPNASSPNVHGATSFALLRTAGPTPTYSNFEYVIFVDGTLEFTPDWASSSVSSLVLRIDGGSLRSTAEFGYPGRGEATTDIVGTMAQANLLTRASSAQITGNFVPASGAFPLNNEILSADPGLTVITPRVNFGHSGDLYMDHELTPNVPANATAIICVEFTGTVGTPGDHQGFTTHGVLTAYTTDELGCGDLFPDLCPPNAGTTCTTFDACATALASVLPIPATAVTAKEKRIAVRLAQLAGKASGFYQHAAKRTGRPRRRLLQRAQTTLVRLMGVATTANKHGTLGVSLDALAAAVNALRATIPSA
jgi:hypothetical protein